MKYPNLTFQPKLKVLSDEQIAEIHSATLELLERVGVQLTHQEARNLLSDAGARVDGNRVRLPAWLVEDALRKAPPRVVLGRRDGTRAVALERDKVWFGASLDCPEYLDPITDARSPFLSTHSAVTATVADALEGLDWVMTIGMADDCPPHIADRVIAKKVLENCEKPLVFCCKDRRAIEDIHRMAVTVSGSEQAFQDAPTLVQYTEPISPLVHFDLAVDKLLFCAQQGIPVICFPAPQAGGTAPISLAGSIVQGSAESLSGLVLCQLVRPGAPFIFGAFNTVMDMRTTVFSYGAPEMSLMVGALSQISQYYGLPFFGTAGCSDSKFADSQAAVEATFSCFSSALTGANLVHDTGWIDHGALVSPAQMVMTNEIIRMIRQYTKGMEVNQETLALDVIEAVGPGGNYLREKHTLKHYKEIVYSDLFDRSMRDGWVKAGGVTFKERLRNMTRKAMGHAAPPLPVEVAKELDQMERAWYRAAEAA